ncbi:zinc finger protein 644 [Scleropages formosus]|uniref:Zinc finger protein 644b n=1 Tax=Scleropages formosus TaxID=113540 RepID=A0A8C9SBU4_SCLFO|nr:zinc finger protein 644 [Scleropages formosus]
MADLKQNAGEEDTVDPVSNNADASQEPFKSQTSSLKNSALRPPLQVPSDDPEKPLNGTQPTHSSTPSSEPQPGTLVNGPGSHSDPEEPGASPGEASPRRVFSETRSRGRKSTPSFVAKTVPVQSETSATPPGGDDGDFEVPVQLAEENQDGMPVSQIRSAEGRDSRRIWDFNMESSESSSDDYESIPDSNWDPQKEFMQFLWSDHDDPELEKTRETTPPPPEQRRRKRKMRVVEVSDPSESLYAFKSSPVHDGSNYKEEPFLDAAFGRKQSSQSSADPCERYPSDTVEAIKQLILNAPGKKSLDGNGIHDSDVGGKVKQLKTGPLMELSSEEEPSFFPCTKCNVNFKEKKHLHRHMMYHLDGNNQVRHVNVPRPFICRECGRSFRDRNSLLKHMIIHQERREKLIEEIKGLNELKDEGRNARLQCPQCIFGTNCPNTFVQHAKTHEKDKRYYCCEECDHMAVTEHELEAHLYTAHRITRKPQYVTMSKRDGSKERRKFAVAKGGHGAPDAPSLNCKTCAFSTRNRNVLKKHVELIHQQPFLQDAESPPYDSNNYAAPGYEPHKLAGKSQKEAARRLQLKPKFLVEKQAFRKKSELPFWSEGLAHLFRKGKTTQKARKGFNSPLSKWTAGNSLNKLSLSLRRGDKQSKLSPQQVDGIDVTTGLPYVDDGYDDDQGYGSLFSGNSEKTNSLSSCYKSPPPKTEKSNSIFYPGYESEKGRADGEDPDSRLLHLEPPVLKKSPSKRKMSTPFRNTTDKATHVLLAKHEATPKKQEMPGSVENAGYEDPYDFSDYTSEATANFLDSTENEENPYARNYFIRRQRFPAKEDRGSSGDAFDRSCHSENDGDAIQKLIVKEECIETDVSAEASGPDGALHSDSFSDFDVPMFGAERKSCPYCPAVFESGVGLSNHVRGHLHRVGLSYDARHVVSPEQVASQDRRPRIRRKITAIRRLKKVHKPESQSEHTCPLCGGWFDTKTGLSNHVRGHLKRIGKTVSSTSKSPLCILNEMMQDEKEYQHILQVLNKKRFLSRPFVSQKFASSDGLFLSPTGIPVKIQHVGLDCKAWGAPPPSLHPELDDLEPRGEEENEVGARGPPSSALIELLKKKKLDEELEMRNRSQTARKCLGGSPPKERGGLTNSLGAETGWTPEKTELNKKVCMHCNTTFHSAVSLSNHLRAYARRKRAALLEGTTYDCKQKKQRSRPGPKKKIFALPHTADEIYRLTCRFCDLVFQGPLSVQEDWIKHLQRHIMNTSVPHTGAGMVEVTSVPIDPPRRPEPLAPPLVSQVAS